MYKYKCIAASNADKEDFYGVIGGLKGLYPEMTEDNITPSDNEFLRREFWLRQNRVMVQYSFSERSVTVFSEVWLGKFYEDREVLEGRFKPTSPKSSNGTMWAISGVFFGVAAVISFFGFSSIFYSSENTMLIIILVLAAAYTVSGILIRRRVDVPLMKLTFWQAGGFLTVIIGLILPNIYLLSICFPMHFLSIIYLLAAIATGYLSCWFFLCVPALEISFLIQAIVGLVMKKVHSSKTVTETVTEENIAEENE